MPQQKYLFSVTHYSEVDADRVARSGRKGAADVLKPKSFPPVADLLRSFIDNGGRIGVCPPCGKTHGVTDEKMVESGAWVGAAAVLAEAQQRQVHSF